MILIKSCDLYIYMNIICCNCLFDVYLVEINKNPDFVLLPHQNYQQFLKIWVNNCLDTFPWKFRSRIIFEHFTKFWSLF